MNVPTSPSLSPADLRTLLSSGFTQADPRAYLSSPPRLSIASRGRTKCGKTHFALMTTPQPVAYIMLDPGSVKLAQKAASMGRIILPKFIEHSKKETKEIAEKLWKDYRASLRTVMATKAIRTLVVDTITEVWELLQLAEFGKLKQNNKWAYGGLNAEFAGLIDELYYTRPDLNLVFIQKVKKEYSALTKDGEEKWDGKSYYAQGYSGLDYLVDLSISHGFNDRQFFFETLSTEATRMGGEFSGVRFKGDECTFLDLALEIYKDHPIGSDPSYWGAM